MDRRARATRFLISAALALLTAAAQPQLPIRESRWLQTNDLVGDLTRQPPECIAWPTDAALRRSAEIGRVAFRAPLILGGQAARAGLSCSSCHRNGRTNPHFHFPGISGDPGTADVTASIMSEHRGDGIFNPKPIPDLAGDPARLKISRDPGKSDLRNFIHGLVTQEFDGPEPPPAVLDGLANYVRSLSPAACKSHGPGPIELEGKLEDVDAAVRLARETLAEGDQATARVMIAAARSMLGAIDERFQGSGDEASRELLHQAAADLASIELADRPTASMFESWQKRWPARKRQLRSAEARSLFNPAVVRRLAGS
jgi:hypothetical protein